MSMVNLPCKLCLLYESEATPDFCLLSDCPLLHEKPAS